MEPVVVVVTYPRGVVTGRRVDAMSLAYKVGSEALAGLKVADRPVGV